MSSDKHYLNFSVPTMIMRKCVQKVLYNLPTCDITKDVFCENGISLSSHDEHIVSDNARLTSCNASKDFTQLHVFEEISQDLVNDLTILRNKMKTNEKILLQNISQNVFNKWSSSGRDEKDLISSSMELTKGKDSSTATAEILQKYFAICNSYLTDEFSDYGDDITARSSKDYTNDIVETRDSMSEDSAPPEHKLTLILPQCDCVTNHEQSESIIKSNQESEDSHKKQGYDVLIPNSIADICWNALLCSVNDKTPEKYSIYFLKKEEEKELASPCFDENMCQQTSACSFCRTTEEEQVQLKECNRVAGPTAMEQLPNELLMLIRQMYHVERCMLFIGLTDVISSMEQNLTEFIVLAENATHLLTPLDFLTRLIKLAKAKNIPYIHACKKEQLGRACCVSTGISVISIKIGPSYFSEKIKDIKCMLMTVISRNSNITL